MKACLLIQPMYCSREYQITSRNYYDQDRYQNRYRSNSGDWIMSYRGRGQYGQNYRGRLQYDQNYKGYFRKVYFRGMQNYRGQNFRGGYRHKFRNDSFSIGRSRSRERQYSGNSRRNEEAVVDHDMDEEQEQVLIEIGLDVLSVESIIILPKIVQIYQIQKKNSQRRYSRCLT